MLCAGSVIRVCYPNVDYVNGSQEEYLWEVDISMEAFKNKAAAPAITPWMDAIVC